MDCSTGGTNGFSRRHAEHATNDDNAADLSQLRNVYMDKKLTGTAETRLVHLLPGHPREPIECTLQAVNLQQIGDYEALSYVWGRKLARETISVNGVSLAVTENLLDALRHLRLADRKRVLWIDAICINQMDIDERNQQVRRMGDIYSRSLRVISWLGTEAEASRAAFTFLAKSYQSLSHHQGSTNDVGWQALKDLYHRDYWRRVWIVQEMCLARRVVVVCGATQIPWVYITELRKRRMHRWPQYLTQGERDFMRSPLSRIDHVRETHQKKGCPLWTLLESFQESQCRVIHDRVYGFLGLASDCSNEDLPIDYLRSVSELYRDVIRFYYGVFRNDSSSPHSSQLISFGEFLRSFFEHHSQLTTSLKSKEPDLKPPQALKQETSVSRDSSTILQISASRVMFIDRFLRHGEAGKFAASELVNFLEGKLPYSHLGFWRDFIDPDLSEVYNVRTSQTFVTSHTTWPEMMDR